VTVGEMRGQIQSLIGPHNGMKTLSAVELDDLVHKACHNVFHVVRNWRTRAETSIDLVAGTAGYDLPSDLLRIESVTVPNLNGSDTVQVRPVPFDDKHLYTGDDCKQGYYLTSSTTPGIAKLVLLPTPASNATDGLEVRYRRRPVKMSTFGVNDEFTEVDTSLHLPLCYEAAFLYLSRQGSKAIKDFASYHQVFVAEVNLERERQQETWAMDASPTISVSFGGLE